MNVNLLIARCKNEMESEYPTKNKKKKQCWRIFLNNITKRRNYKIFLDAAIE